MKHLTTFALFCNFIAIIGACLYLIFRTGFDTPTEPIFLVLGLSSLLLNFSNHFYSLWLRLRPALQQTTPPWYLSDNALNLGIFFFITALGYVEAQFLAYPLALVGYVLLLNNLRLFLSSQSIARSLGGGFLALFFSLWVANTVWGRFCNEPTLVETALFFSKEMFFPTLIDTFYHITAAQIHKTYQTVSTGLDGLPFMYYHTYSHWTMGQFSKLTGVSVLEIYSMGYVVLIAPFFFRAFLSFVAEVRLFFLQPSSGHISLNFYFWLTFLALFIQFPRHLYSGGLLGLPFIIVESYTFSLFFLVGWFSLLMAFWKTPTQSSFTKGLFLWFVLPFLYFCICYSSISTGFVLAGLIAYLFFRLRLFRKGAYVLATGLLAVVFVGTYLLAVETNIFGRSYHQEGELAFFYFFFHTHPFEAFNFWGLFYGWLYAAIITCFYVVKKGSRNALPINPALPGYLGAEIVLVIAFFGLLPCFFVKMLGGTAMYFLGIQLWVSGGLLMALLPNVQIALPTAWKINRIVPVLGSAVVLLLLYVEVRNHLSDAFKDNIQTRKNILQRPDIQLNGLQIIESYYTNPQVRQQVDLLYSRAVQQRLDTTHRYRFAKALMALDKMPLRDKQHTVMYIDFAQANLNLNLIYSIQEAPLLIPAISGVAMIDGLTFPADPKGAYGYAYYPARPKPNHTYTKEALKIEAKKQGFKTLLWYDANNYSFEKIAL